MRFKNVSPLGDLELPLLGRVVESGEVFDLDESLAHLLDGQDATWEPVDPDPQTVDEQLLALGLPVTGNKGVRERRLAAALAAADEPEPPADDNSGDNTITTTTAEGENK